MEFTLFRSKSMSTKAKKKASKKKVVEKFVSEPFEYQPTDKKITLSNLVEDACNNGECGEFAEDLEKFIIIYGGDLTKHSFSSMMEEIIKHDNLIHWLIDNGFLRQETTGSISVGDRFVIDGQTYLLCETEETNSVMLINMETGGTFTQSNNSVNDITCIDNNDELFCIFDIDEDEGEYSDLAKYLKTRIPKQIVAKKKK